MLILPHPRVRIIFIYSYQHFADGQSHQQTGEFETVLFDTPSFSASCSCVRFFSLRLRGVS